MIAAGAILGRRVRLDSGGTLTVFDHPAGGTAWWGTAQAVFFLALAVSWLIWLARQAFACRHSTGERRLQLKWLLSGAAAGIILAVGGFVVSITIPALQPGQVRRRPDDRRLRGPPEGRRRPGFGP